jgi:Acetyltransferase (GNAT) family
MAVSLRPLTPPDAPILQRLYDACPAAFTSLLGRPAPPDLAANDLTQALATPGRTQLGVFSDEDLIGFIDCKLDADIPDRAHLGLLLLASPYDDPAIASPILRILTRWLIGLGIARLETGVPAHDATAIRFWLGQSFSFTGEQYRRELPGYAPRFLVMALPLTDDDGRKTIEEQP